MNNPIGIYIHVPFCASKCGYCDFYSLPYSEELMEKYVNRIVSEINRWGDKLRRPADTLYFGGGTPSLLRVDQVERIIFAARQKFSLEGAEITVEVNPAEDLKDWLVGAKKAGINRISVGFQSANEKELKTLLRRHTLPDAIRTVEDIKTAGIDNFSLDIMLGIPHQNSESLRHSLDVIAGLGPCHISAYMLSVEEGTYFHKNREKLNIPNDDEVEKFYLETVKFLEKKGYRKYEISNFSKDGKTSKHNTKYWTGKEYLGLGPAAHSLLLGKRFYYDRNLSDYLKNPKEIPDGDAGDFEEWFMLKIRLSDGFSFEEIAENFEDISSVFAKNKADLFVKGGMMKNIDGKYSLTDKGALVSNTVISELLGAFGQKK